jgi:hypothetical protein
VDGAAKYDIAVLEVDRSSCGADRRTIRATRFRLRDVPLLPEKPLVQLSPAIRRAALASSDVQRFE